MLKKVAVVVPMRRFGNKEKEKEVTVRGYAFDCEGIELVVHRSFAPGEAGQWSVSEPRTGARVLSGPNKKSRAEAVAFVQAKMTQWGADNVREKIANVERMLARVDKK